MLRRRVDSSSVPGPNGVASSAPVIQSRVSRMDSASSRCGTCRDSRVLFGSRCLWASERADDWRYVWLVIINRWRGLRRQPPRMSSPASQSSSSGCEGGVPWAPKSLGVATSPWPKWCCHRRLTITRATRWPAPSAGSVIQRASDRRRPEYGAPVGGCQCHRDSASGVFSRTRKNPWAATPRFCSVLPRWRKWVSGRKSPPWVCMRTAGKPSPHVKTGVRAGLGRVLA